MTFLFTLARALSVVLKAVQAAVGIMMVTHGAYQWARSRRAR